ncbi:MAG: hypothetical protein ACTSWY_01655, partial [Promethearchaeota archaeon]
MSEQLEKIFMKLTLNLGINFLDYITEDLSDEQKKIFNKAKEIFQQNINGEIKKFGGKENPDNFKDIENEINKRLENPVFKPFLKELEELAKKWLKLKKEELKSLFLAVIPVKELPFPSVSFMTVPRIVWEKNKPEKMELNSNCIAYLGEIKGLVTRTVLYGKIADEDPLFAPHIGQLDLADYKPDPNDDKPKSEDIRFISEIVSSIERKTTQNQVVRYHAQYERHGEPICDFLNEEDDLGKSMEKLTSAIDSNRQSSNAAISAIIIPLINTSMVLCLDESSGTSTKKFETCFESLMKLGASSYETPNLRKNGRVSNIGGNIQQSGVSAGVGSVQPHISAQPKLPIWTEEGLAEEAKKRDPAATNLPVWTEEGLAEEAKKRDPAATN